MRNQNAIEIDDFSQQSLVELDRGSTLVLAGPGCGKTHILARRILHANTMSGIAFSEMLCLTFTNRAAREMKSRIERLSGHNAADLFVGNIHRFCLRFLFENEIIPADTSVLDEEDCHEFLASSLSLFRAADIKEFFAKAAFLYQSENGHPQWTTRHPQSAVSGLDRQRIEAYTVFKEENRLIDFDDILLLTYTTLLSSDTQNLKMAGYRWLQVDEVQDMTPLQLAIIERICAPDECTRMFLGDEQQAIFNFIGAGGRALDYVKQMCRDNITHLSRNYRSPRYLVDLCNTIASSWLGIDPAFLPKSVKNSTIEEPLTTYTASPGNLRLLAASHARRWLAAEPNENVAILTRTNGEADDLSNVLSQLGIEHFHISKQDIFHQLPFKTVWAHLAVVANPMQWHPWARLIYQTGATRALGEARALVALLRENAISVSDLLNPGAPTTVERFSDAMGGKRTIVVVDTETSGLDIFNDDVVQLSAIKIKDGKILAGSEFEIFIESDKSLPGVLSDGSTNPLIETYDHATKLPPDEAFAEFISYLGDDFIIAGHNIGFELAVIRENIKRRPAIKMPDFIANPKQKEAIDTLDVARLLLPRLRSYRLGFLAGRLHIDVGDAHNATDDVKTTAMLAMALRNMADEKLPQIRRTMSMRDVVRTAERFDRYYGDFYQKVRQQLYVRGGSLADAIAEANAFFAETGATAKISHMDYLLRLIGQIVDEDEEPHFRDQLSRHLYDLLTYHESDLFSNGIVRERLSVMTVHKAKGLEADNVIVYDASARFGNIDDHARLIYVAFSRARRRLAVGLSQQADPVLATVLHCFHPMSRREISAAVNAEAINLQPDNEYYL